MEGQAESRSGDASRFLWNVIWLFLLLLAGGWWFPRFTGFGTSQGPVIVGFLAIAAGVFGTIWGWLDKDRTEPIESALRKRLFGGRLASCLLPALCALLALVAGFVGTIKVDPAKGGFSVELICGESSRSHSVWGSDSALAPFLAYLWKPTIVEVRARGLPGRQVEIRPLRRVTVDLDWFFLKPAALLTPSKRLHSAVKANPKCLVITIDGKPYEHSRYVGQAVWIGMRDGVELPMRVLDDWRYRPEVDPDLLKGWRRPITLAGAPAHLPQGTKVQVEMFPLENGKRGKNRYGEAVTFELELPAHRDRFPQQIWLRSVAERIDAGSPRTGPDR